jgi:hypothetical protein
MDVKFKGDMRKFEGEMKLFEKELQQHMKELPKIRAEALRSMPKPSRSTGPGT